MSLFSVQVDIRWADVDLNQHVRHSVYYDLGAHTRMRYLEHIGFHAQKLFKLGLGPILFHEQCSFIQEIKMNDTVTINILRGDFKEDGSQWSLHHEITNSNGKKCAHITVKGAWMDVIRRKVTAPPEELRKEMLNLEIGSSYSRNNLSRPKIG